MEEENRKLRKAARRDYMDNVRELVAFVRKRDKRVAKFQVKFSLLSAHCHEPGNGYSMEGGETLHSLV
jgi:hypothetical protein